MIYWSDMFIMKQIKHCVHMLLFTFKINAQAYEYPLWRTWCQASDPNKMNLPNIPTSCGRFCWLSTLEDQVPQPSHEVYTYHLELNYTILSTVDDD